MASLSSQIEACLGDDEYLVVLKEIVARVDVKFLLNEALGRCQDEPLYRERLCRSSYRHPNGFIKLALLNESADWAVRVHHWPEPVDEEHNDIHDHCGPFVSRILGGALENINYVEDSGEEHPAYHVYRDFLDDSVHSFHSLGMQRLRIDDVRVLEKGMVYHLGADIIHRSSPRSPFPCTSIVIQAPKEKRYSTIYKQQPAAEKKIPTLSDSAFVTEALLEVLKYV